MNNFVIIVNYYGEKNTINCLKSVINHSSRVSILIVDNGSPVDFAKYLKNKFPKVNYIKNSRNVGFAKGCNVGIRYVIDNGADNIILLNNDVVISQNNIENLIKCDGDIIGSVLKYSKNNIFHYDLGGHINFWTGRAYHEEVTEQYLIKKTSPDYVSGAVMLIRKKVINKIGYFDEKYFLYYEDADYCVRASNAGFKITVDIDTIIYHKLSAALGRKSPFILYHNLRSNLIFIFKNISIARKPFALMYWILLCSKVLLNWFLRKD